MQNMQNKDSEVFCILISAIAYYFAYYSIFFCILYCILHSILFCILQHINLHIYAPICKIICQKILHCLYSAYSAYCYMQNMQNIHLNMQKYVTEYIWNPVPLDRIGQNGTYWFVPVGTGTSTRRYRSVQDFNDCTCWYVLVHPSTYFQEVKLFSDPPRKSQER